jgi:phage I-like protein
MLIASFHSALPDDAGVPEWVHLLPAGIFSGKDGRGPFKLGDAGAVIAASMADGKLAIDENHSTDLAGPVGQPSPARGWIVAMQARADGIWGQVKWTPPGEQLMAERAYRGFSPVFQRDAGGNVTRILRAALTNTPNLPQLSTLHHQGPTMDLTKLRAALGLPDTADEAAILAAASAATSAVSLHSQHIAAIAAAAGAKASTTDGLVVELQAIRATTVDPARFTELQSRLDALLRDQARGKATVFIDAAITAGKPINPTRNKLIELHMADPAGIEGLVNAMPSINAGGVVVQPPSDGAPVLSAVDREVAERMGIDPVKFAEFNQKQGASA